MSHRRPSVLGIFLVVLAGTVIPASAQIPKIASNGSLGDFVESRTVIFNTDTGGIYVSTFWGPGTLCDSCARIVSQPNGQDIAVWDFANVNVTTDWHIVGTRPGAIAATGNITVSSIVAAENGFPGAPSPVTCPGGVTGCGAGTPGSGPGGGGGGAGPGWYIEIPGGTYDPLAGGGGGGGASSANGDKGADSRTILGADGQSYMLGGGAAGTAYFSRFGPLIAGSGGGSGGDRAMWGGPQTYGGAGGGAGGGAVILAAGGDAIITGTVSAAGKSGSPSNDGGGGGGGAGGYVVLQVGGTLTIGATGAISAAGGQGGTGPGGQVADSFGGKGGGGFVSIEAGAFVNAGNIDVSGANPGAILFPLTIAATGTGSGTVTSDPGGLNCAINSGSAAGDCVTFFASNALTTLTATPSAGSHFVGWSGSCSSGVVAVSAAMTCTAEFAPIARYLLSTTTNPASGGTVAVSPGSSDGFYGDGASVQLTASANTGFAFAGWSGDRAGMTNPLTVTMNAALSVTANFTPLHRLTMIASPAAGGSIVAAPSSGDGLYADGTSVQLTAVANAGFAFAGWSGDLTGLVNPQSVTMSGPRTVTANFTALQPADFQLAADARNGSAAATVRAGRTATYRLTASGVNGFAGAVALSCSDDVPLGGCTVSRPQLAVGGTAPARFMVTVATTGSSHKDPSSATPPGTYTIVLTGTSGELVHALALTLTVK